MVIKDWKMAQGEWNRDSLGVEAENWLGEKGFLIFYNSRISYD